MRNSVILRILIALTFVLLAGGGLFYALASAGPISTGSGLFALQGLAEQSWLGLQPQPTARASYALDLLDRRTRDLVAAIGQPNEMDNLVMVNQTLNQAVLELSNLSPQEREAASTRILSQVAVQDFGGKAARGQFVGQVARAEAGAGEDQRAGDRFDFE